MSRNGCYVPRALGTAYTPSSEGASEGDRGQPEFARAMHGLREDDAMLKLGYSGGGRAFSEDPYAGRTGFKQDAFMRGLREDDAMLKLGTAYAPASEGGAEGDQVYPVPQRAVHGFGVNGTMISNGRTGYRIGGLREDDAMLRLGESAEAPFAPMDGMGTAFYPSAEGASEGDYPYRPSQQAIRGLREEDANIIMRGLREDDAAILLKGLREEDAAIVLRGLREEDAAILLKGLREDDAAIKLTGLREDDAQVLLTGLREDDAMIHLARAMGEDTPEGALDKFGRVMGYRKGFGPQFDPVRKTKGVIDGVNFLGAEDFHPRFPVELKIEGLGRASVSGWLDFLKPLPSDEEYLGKIRIVIEGWNRVKPQLYNLPTQSKNAIIANMTAAQSDPGRYDGMTGFLAEGASAKTTSRWERVQRLEAYLPTVQKLVDQYKALGAGVTTQTPQQTQQVVNQTAVQDVQTRIDASPKADVLTDYVLPYGGAAVGAGVLTLVGLKLAGKL